MAATPFSTISTRMPDASTTPAAANCPASFTGGGSERRSSIRPNAKTIAAPPAMPASSHVGSIAPVSRHAPMPASRPRKMPTPPNDGVSCVVPAVARRGGDEAAAEAVAQQHPDRQRGDREGDDCCDGAHGENGSAGVLSTLCGRPFRYRVRRARDGPAARAAALPRLPRLARGRGRGAALPRLRRACSRSRTACRGCSTTACPASRPSGARSRAGRRWRRRKAGTSPTTRSTRICRTSTATSAGTTRTGARPSTRSRCCSTATCGPACACSRWAAAKAWAPQHLVPLGCEYVATDILADPVIGLGRGAFYEERVGAFGRVQADGEHLPVRLGGVRRHVLRRRAAPRARPDGDGARDGARHAQGRLGVRAERGHARARRRRRRPRPGRRRRATASTSTCTRSTRTSGRSRARASSCGASSRRRGTRSWPTGGSPAACCGCPAWGAAPRRSSPRPATATPACPSMPVRAVPRLLR